MRSAQSQSKNAANTAGEMAGSYEGTAAAENAQLTPFLQKEINTKHGYDPGQLNEMLTAAGAGTGGATGALNEEATLAASRGGSTSGTSALLDSIARGAQQSMAKGSEDIAAEDVTEAKRENQAGAAGLGELYGVNTDAALKAMGVQSQDISNEIEAGKSGWFQNLTGMIGALGQAAQGAGSMGLKV